VDETYVKVAGRWRYGYPAVDQSGHVVDVFVSPRRDAKAARQFFERAIGATKVTPVEVTTDKAPVCTRSCFRNWCQRHGIAPTSTPTIALRPTTAG
jgi:transposase-like protein